MLRNIVLAALLLSLPGLGMSFQDDYVWQQKYKKALPKAQEGNAKAQYQVGEMLENGKGVARDFDTAFNWYLRSAKQNHVKASFKVGYGYLKGKGVTPDYELALEWLTKAANKDYTRAQYYLAQMYELGKGIDENPDQALSWYERAAAGGYRPAGDKVTELQQVLARQKPSKTKALSATETGSKAVSAAVAVKNRKSPGVKIKEIMLQSHWQKSNKPVEYLPSKLTKCKSSGKTIECQSGKLTRNIGMADIEYVTKAVLHDIKADGKFHITYRNNVKKIQVTDQDFVDSGNKIPVTTGWQNREHSLSCKLDGKYKLICTKDNMRKVTLKGVKK